MDIYSLQKSILKILALLAVLITGITTQMYAQGLNVYLASSSDAVGAGDALNYTLVASNTGSTTLENVRIEIRLPRQINSFNRSSVVGDGLNCGSNSSCSPDETIIWQVGSLTPGENIRNMYATQIANSPPSGDIETIIVASADEVSDIIFTHSVAFDPSPLMRISLVPDIGPAVPGEAFSYTITYGNIGSTSPENVVLTMPLPEGTTYQSSSHEGSISDGVITWALGTVGVGAGGRVQITVIPDAELAQGETLEAEAIINSGISTELTVTSEALTEIGTQEGLEFDFRLSKNAIGNSGVFTYTLIATNSNSQDILNASARIRLPQEINSFRSGFVVGSGLNCGSDSNCSPNETVTWNIGLLAPRQSRTMIIRTFVNSSAQQGEILRLFYEATADGFNELTGGVDIIVDPSPIAELALISEKGPAAPDEEFTYTLLFSNIGFQPTDVALRLILSENVTLVSASHGGTEADGELTWEVPDVAEDSPARVQATVKVDPMLKEGSILTANASLDTGSPTEYELYSDLSTPVRGNIPLNITYASDIADGLQGDPVRLRIDAENSGTTDLTDVSAKIKLPRQINSFNSSAVIGSGLNCGGNSSCSGNETVSWNIGILAPGQSRTIIMPTNIANNAPEGSFMLSPVVATATGSNEVLLYNDILVGTPVNFPPTAAVITSPEDGASLLIGSEEGEEPDPADTPFVVEWGASADPEEDNITYTWQLSPSSDFSTFLVNSPSSESGTDTHFETDYATLSTLLSDNGVDVGSSIELYHRVVTSDGSNTVEGDAFSVILTRGLVTNLETEPGIPREFALYNNYPNPFNPTTTFRFDLPEMAPVELMVYDMIGRRVATIVAEELPAGQFQFTWDAGHLSSGIYLYRLKAGSFSQTNKLVLLK